MENIENLQMRGLGVRETKTKKNNNENPQNSVYVYMLPSMAEVNTSEHLYV